MAHVAREMERDDWCRCRQIPLLIGGATTSRVHTAVKIAPHYSGPVIWVPDASRSVPVAQSLTSDAAQKGAYLGEVLKDYAKLRERHAAKNPTKMLSLEAARANAAAINLAEPVPTPRAIGRRVLRSYPLDEIAQCIDWTPFFQTWDLAGPFPAILEDTVVGAQARQVYADGKAMLARLIEGRRLMAHGAFVLLPARRTAPEDITVYADESLQQPVLTWHGLRQQTEKPRGEPNKCLADYVAPASGSAPSNASGPTESASAEGVRDYLGGFAVGIHGADKIAQDYEAKGDDYNAILVKALADRLAEAFAERLHQRIRTEFWGYAAQESLTNAELIAEKYQGIRPAPGYPACPDHSVKQDLFGLLHAADIDMRLTENLAMLPAAAVSGFYFWRPEAQYFNLGPIGHDQRDSYIQRVGCTKEEAERRLAPLLP
jgi:5-methyltetrahydrofolate--homocysteine methyltransferase